MIHGLEGRARLPRLGIIRQGILDISPKTHKSHPREVEYFVLPPELKPILEERPTKLAVMFPSDDIDRVLQASYEKRGGKLLELRCDGQKFLRFRDDGTTETGACQKEPLKPCPCGALAKGHLNVIIPQAGIGIYWVLVGGEQRLADVLSELVLFKETFGRLTNIVFELEKVPSQIQVRTATGLIARTGWPVHVRVAAAFDQAIRAQGIDLRQLPGGQILPGLALPASTEDENEAAPDANGGDEPSPAVPLMPVSERSPLNRSKSDLATSAKAAGLGGEEWDISMCYQAAKALGFPPSTYGQYLRAHYGVGADDLAPEMLHAEAEFWRKAEESPLAGQTAKSVVLAVLRKGEQERMF